MSTAHSSPLRSSPSSRRSCRLRRLSLAGIATAVLSLTGCASYFGAQVTAYHQQDLSLQGLSYRLQPPAGQEESLAYATHAARVREHLMKFGMVETGASRRDVDVRFDYSVDQGQPVHYQQPEYAYVYRGSRPVRRDRVQPDGSVVSYWEMYPMYGYDLVGYTSYQRMVFTHQLRLTLTRAAESGKPRQGLARLYEGSVVHQSASNTLNNIVPLMVEALFQDFPGPNGQTRRVEVQTDPGVFGRKTGDKVDAGDTGQQAGQGQAAGGKAGN